MPLLCSIGIIVMFAGLMFLHTNHSLGIAIMLLGTFGWVAALYKWLLTPLEDHH